MARKELRCEECTLPVGYLQNGAVIFETRHRGEKHVTVYSLATLVALAHCDGPGKVTLSAEPVDINHKEGSLLR